MTQLTVLTTNPKKPLTKTIFAKTMSDGSEKIEIQQYDTNIKYFSSKSIPVKNFASLADALSKLQGDIYSCIIRGCVAENVNIANHPRTKRGASLDGTIIEVDQQWCAIDIDNFNISPFGVSSREEAITHILGMLPTCFAKASCFWKFSATTGFKADPNIVSIHFYFWLSEPASNTDLKEYFDAFNKSIKEAYGIERLVDTVFFDSIQIHYTAAPHLIDLPDPVSRRFGIIEGKTDSVVLAEDFNPAGSVEAQNGALQKYIESIGDDKDGIHGPLLSASMVFVRMYGSGENAKNSFKMMVRDALGKCDTSKHSASQMERYRSDQYLDQLLRTADTKHQAGVGGSVQPAAFLEMSKYILFTEAHKYYNEETSTEIGKDLFCDLTAKFFNGKRHGAAIFTSDPRFRKASYAAMIPGEKSYTIVKVNGTPIYNTWAGRNGLMKEEYNVDMMIEHINYLCDQRLDEAGQLLDFMAYIISNPGKKVSWAPIISGVEGTGKSTIKEVLRKVYAAQHTAEISVVELESSFNPYATSELLFIEETFNTDKSMVTSILKKLITDPMIDINIKFVKQKQTRNYLNVMLFTNDRNPLHMDASDRRYLFIRSEAKPQSPEYYKEMYKWIEGASDDIFTWAHKRDLSKFSPTAPPIVTAAKLKNIRASVSANQQFLADALLQEAWPFQHDVCYVQALQAALQSHPLFRTIKLSTLEQIMENIGVPVTEEGGKKFFRVRGDLIDLAKRASGTIIGKYTDFYDVGGAF